MTARKVLHLNVDTWPHISAGQRLKILHDALEVVERVFGTDGERWSRMTRADRESEIKTKLDSLVVWHGEGQPEVDDVGTVTGS